MLGNPRFFIRLVVFAGVVSCLAQAMTPPKKKKAPAKSAGKALVRHAALGVAVKASPGEPVPAPVAPTKTASRTASKTRAKTVARGPWRAPNYADSTAGDVTVAEDPIARQAAIEALGKLNGAIVISDANTGRILTMVNQKLALKSGFQPCSTIKVPVALAALSESVVNKDTRIRLYGRTSMGMTEALAKSSNQYFASLGEKLGFERVSYYARLFGLGEKAGLDIDEEQPGILPPATPKSGMGMMTSFGDGITLTPLEFAGLLGAVANGGTLYYLQYPKSHGRSGTLLPQVKRQLEIADLIPEIKPGMEGAVEYGTARRISAEPHEPIYGKTGTCTDTRTPTHLGWFGSFTEAAGQKVVVVVLLTGGSVVSGPAAAGVAGSVYKNLEASNFFTQGPWLAQAAERQGPKKNPETALGLLNFGLGNSAKP